MDLGFLLISVFLIRIKKYIFYNASDLKNINSTSSSYGSPSKPFSVSLEILIIPEIIS